MLSRIVLGLALALTVGSVAYSQSAEQLATLRYLFEMDDSFTNEQDQQMRALIRVFRPNPSGDINYRTGRRAYSQITNVWSYPSGRMAYSNATESWYYPSSRIAYNGSLESWTYANGRQAYNGTLKSWYYPNNRIAYNDSLQSWHYRSGRQAYNNATDTWYYPNSRIAYSGSLKQSYYPNGQVFESDLEDFNEWDLARIVGNFNPGINFDLIPDELRSLIVLDWVLGRVGED